MTKNIAGKNLLPAVFIVLCACAPIIMGTRQAVGRSVLEAILGGVIMVWIGSRLCRLFRTRAPMYANYGGIAVYWLCVAAALVSLVFAAFDAYSGRLQDVFLEGLIPAAFFWVVGLGARRALTVRVQALSTE